MKYLNLFDLDALQSRASQHSLPSFKVKQIFFELFKNQHLHREEMTTLSKDLKAELAQSFVPISLSLLETVEAPDTTKFAFQTRDGHLIESMLMLHRQDEKYHQPGTPRKLNRITLCISSQVGCPVNCLFCVTGKLGFKRNLTINHAI